MALKDALPSGDYKLYGDQDTATFKSLWEAARDLEEDCLLSSGLPGWIPAGELNVERRTYLLARWDAQGAFSVQFEVYLLMSSTV